MQKYSFLNFKKVEKKSDTFLDTMGCFSKMAGIKARNFENFRKFVNKNAIKH